MRAKFLILITLLSGSVFLSSCSKDDNSSSSSSSAQNLEQGKTWKVSYYYDTDKEETYKFSSYTFEFRSDGTLHATNSSGTSAGNWSIGSRFNITSFTISPLDDLNDDWVIVSQGANVIKLRDDNTTKIEELHFTLM